MSSRASERLASRLLLGVLGVAAVLGLSWFTFAYVTTWENSYSSDTALIGLMAKSILTRGELPIFVWSVGYQGMLLEAYPTALLFRLFGVSPSILNITPTVYLWIALAIWTFGVAKAFSPVTAFLTLLATIGSAPIFFQLNTRTMPNFPEILALGGLALLLFQRIGPMLAAGVTPRRRDLALFGFVCGLAMYTFAIFAYYLFAMVACVLVLWFRDEIRRSPMAFAGSWIMPWSRLQGRPKVLRYGLTILGIVAWLALALGVATIGVDDATVDFLGRAIKWNPLKLIATGSAVLIAPRLALDALSWIGRNPHARPLVTALGGGMLLGYSPALYHKLILGGQSVKGTFAHGSFAAIQNRASIFFDFHRNILHFGDGPSPVLAWAAGAFYLICIGAFLTVGIRRWIGLGLDDPGASGWSSSIPYALVPAITFAIFIVSKTVVDAGSQRYLVFLIPIYALSLGWAVAAAWSKRVWARPALVLGYLGVVGLGVTSIQRDLDIARYLPNAAIDRAMSERGLKYAYADYWLAYSTSFLTDERLIVEPIYSNYSPHYGAPVRDATRIGYLDRSPSKYVAIDGKLEIKGQHYRVAETVALEDGITLQVLDRE